MGLSRSNDNMEDMLAWYNVLASCSQIVGQSWKTHLFPFGQANPKIPI